MALVAGGPAHAAEIKVLSTNAVKSALLDLGPKFEKSSGDKLAITWGTAAELTQQIAKGAAVDVAIVTDAGLDGLIKQGKLASSTPLARSALRLEGPQSLIAALCLGYRNGHKVCTVSGLVTE